MAKKQTTTHLEHELIKQKIQDAFSGLHFDEETHTYTYDGFQLVSTTTYIDKFSADFQSYFASEAKGNKNTKANPNDKRDGTYYRRRWKYIADEASNAGSRVHLFAECYPHFDLPMCNKEQGIVDFYNSLPSNYVVLFTELRVFDKATKRAGTMDGLLYNINTGKLVIIDWKTNSRNINECYKNKKMIDKFEKLYATSLNKFSLQLSDYANIITKNTQLEIEERWIIWLYEKPYNYKDSDRNDDYVIVDTKPDLDAKNYKLYKVKDYSKEIEEVLQKEKIDKLKPAKPKTGLFKKKESPKKKSLASIISKAKNK